MKNVKRWVIIVLCVILLAAMLSSLLILACGIDHDCTGADCMICAALHQCKDLLSRLSAIFAWAMRALAVIVLWRALARSSLKEDASALTAQKIRLNI